MNVFMFCFFVFRYQYQCIQLPGETRLRSDPLCVEWDVKPYTLTEPDSGPYITLLNLLAASRQRCRPQSYMEDSKHQVYWIR